MKPIDTLENIDTSHRISSGDRLPETESLRSDFSCDVDALDAFQLLSPNACFPKGKVLADLQAEGIRVLPLEEALQDEFLASKAEVFRQRYLAAPMPVPKNTADYAKGSELPLLQERKRRGMEAAQPVLIYIPENTVVSKPLQWVQLYKSRQSSFLQNVLWIYMESSSELKFIHCMDSDESTDTLANTVIELEMQPRSRCELISMQNLNDRSSAYINLDAALAERAELSTFAVNLNAREVEEIQQVNLRGRESRSNLYGVYLMDKEQKVKNRVKVNHWGEGTRSRQLFKGILDDAARGEFFGHIFVNKNAQGTQAYQNNRNLLLTSKAKVSSKPFLEIYADDVKCSHGATTGQLDEQALFYMRCRGISEAQARRLLMFAFAGEVIRQVSVPPLQQRLEEIVSRRLRGELKPCSQCALHCMNEEHCHLH